MGERGDERSLEHVCLVALKLNHIDYHRLQIYWVWALLTTNLPYDTDWKLLLYTFHYLDKQTLLSSQFIYAGFYSYYSLPKIKIPENILLIHKNPLQRKIKMELHFRENGEGK